MDPLYILAAVAIGLIGGMLVGTRLGKAKGDSGAAREAASEEAEKIRKAAITHRVSSVTTVEAALAAVQGMAEHVGLALSVRSLQEYHA